MLAWSNWICEWLETESFDLHLPVGGNNAALVCRNSIVATLVVRVAQQDGNLGLPNLE